ncbi:hypothetical protein AM499_06670 [Bacillus sp. FJAT-22090]|uniref:hypothetical protein n=1 Tax=Bacillus sp. FJAT-22090 TaxID=1581038 RepID=UPI0006B01A1C|nr:hypothetical protein [Bacillus sp. FJAT-22090]ALC85535.1 hypothetical protein AM499_06670 [Bacillus sp. FJAT-22090]
MDSQKELNFLKALYDTMYGILTYSPSELGGIIDKETSLMHLVPLGMGINPKDFENMKSPTNPEGNAGSSENFSRFVNAIPKISAKYERTLENVENIYGQMMLANVVQDESPSPAEIEEYNNALKVLWVNRDENIKTKRYQAYQKSEDAYLYAVAAFNSLFLLLDMTKPEDKEKWDREKGKLEIVLKRARDDFKGIFEDVENALYTVKTKQNKALSEIIAKDKTLWDETFVDSVVDPDYKFHYCYANPSNWYAPDATGFTSVTISSENHDDVNSTRFTDLGGGTDFTAGLWVVDLNVDGETKREHRHVGAEKINITVNYAIVTIERPWLDYSLFRFTGWEVYPPYEKGQISGGDLKTSIEKNSLMPLIPQSFIIVRDISITGEWTEEDKVLIEKSINGGGGVSFLGFGSFGISGDKKETHEEFHSEFVNGTIKTNGLQVLAWISKIVPFCPSQQ